MTITLSNPYNANFSAFGVTIPAMGTLYGGIAQIFAGLPEYKKGNTFGLAAFTSYGSLWLTLVVILTVPKTGLADTTNGQFLGVYLGLWGVFTLLTFSGTPKVNRALQFAFLSLIVLFVLLVVGNTTGNEAIIRIADQVGLAYGASTIHLVMGEVSNEQFGRTILPVGEAH